MQNITRWFADKFRTKGTDNFRIIRVLAAFNQNQCVCIRLAQQVFCFVDFICSVYSNQHCTDFDSCPKCNVPCRNIGCPNGDFCAAFNTQRNQRARKRIHISPKLCIGARIIQSCIFKSNLVWELFCYAIQNLWKCFAD